MKQLSNERQHLRYQSRSIREEEKRKKVKTEIADLTSRIGELRKEVVLCDGIAARSGIIKQKIQIVRQETTEGKEQRKYEHIGRSR